MHAFQRTLSSLALAALLGAASVAHAQSAAPVDAEKQKLIDQIIAVWHPENAVLMAAQRPAQAAMEQSRVALEQKQLPKEKVEAALKDILVDVQKYVDTVNPLVVNSAKKNMNATVAPLLQSPVKAKFEKLIPQADQALGKKIQDDVGAEINKDIGTMNQAAGTKLRAAVTAAGK